jgi:putative iron-regulated protein
MKKYTLPLAFVAVGLIASCSGDDESSPQTTPSVEISEIDATLKSNVVSNYATIVEASYADAVSTAKELKVALDAFASSPSETTLMAAKDAWKASREPYGQTEAYRFYEGPIDNESDGPEGDINAWPLDENIIDYVVGAPTSGFINVVEFDLTEDNIRGKNGTTDETAANVATGYHAIEFILWGQDNVNPKADNGAGGQRPLTDFTTKANASRRLDYLKVVAKMLVDDLELVHDQWKSTGAYRVTFEADVDGSIDKIITGMGNMANAELAPERIEAALQVAQSPNSEEAAGAQEDEHSCFSDNTHRDMVLNFEGCTNVLKGEYIKVNGQKVSGASILDVLAASNAANAAQLVVQADAISEALPEITIPFDVALIDDQAKMQSAVDQLVEFGDLAADMKLGLGL